VSLASSEKLWKIITNCRPGEMSVESAPTSPTLLMLLLLLLLPLLRTLLNRRRRNSKSKSKKIFSDKVERKSRRRQLPAKDCEIPE
jgi:MYXO-CTERM domain-containing protein